MDTGMDDRVRSAVGPTSETRPAEGISGARGGKTGGGWGGDTSDGSQTAMGTSKGRNGTILAIDLGTQSGWALRTSAGRIHSGSESFAVGKQAGPGMRWMKFRKWLWELHANAGGLNEIWYESVARHVGTGAAHIYGGFSAMLYEFGERHKIEIHGVAVGTIKKHATGKGNAKKADMIAAAQAAGFHPIDDNEADAIALLRYSIARHQ
jgi:hypothetical protein